MPFRFSVQSYADYFQLKRRLRIYQRIFGGLPASLAFLSGSGTFLALPIFNPTQPVFGVDPIIALGSGMLLGTGLAFLTGSSLFGLLLRSLNKPAMANYGKFDAEFAKRVQRFRANVPPDPNQIGGTDFYGEKVRSLSDYRHWLKRQKALIASRTFSLK